MFTTPSRKVSRRGVLAAVGVSTLSGVAGCLGGGGGAVNVLSAGSLARTFEDHVGPAFEAETELDLHGEYYGTNAVMRMVTEGTKHPDVIVSADATLLRDRLSPCSRRLGYRVRRKQPRESPTTPTPAFGRGA